MARILFAIDHKWRDLPGHVYAGMLLEQKGHEVLYVRNNLEKYAIEHWKPQLVVVNHLLSVKKQEFAKQLKSRNIRVAVMPTEGIPTLEGMRKFAGAAECDLSGVDLHFVWNHPMAEIIRANPTLPGESVVVTGVPRFDFYRQPLSASLATKREVLEKYGLNKDYPVVTFATNFTQASFHVANQEFHARNSSRLGFDAVASRLFGSLQDVCARDFQSRALLCDAFFRLVEALPRVNFILKLHPSEDHQYYYRLISEKAAHHADRIRVVTQEYIWDVLNATDVELKRSCTTGIESWILGKPTIELQLNPDEWYFSEDHASGSDVVHSEKELLKTVEDYLSGAPVRDELLTARTTFLEKWCHGARGDATRTMVEHVNRVLDGSHSSVPEAAKGFTSWKRKAYYRLMTTGDYLGHDLRVYGLKNVLRRRYVDKLGRIDKHLHQRDVARWESRLRVVS